MGAVGREGLDDLHVAVAVDGAEVPEVHAVLGGLLGMGGDALEVRLAERRPALEALLGWQPRARPPTPVVAREDHSVDLVKERAAGHALGRRLGPVAGGYAGPRGVEAEAVHGAADRLTLHAAAVTEVRAHVRAERVEHDRRPAPGPIEHPLAAEDRRRPHVTGPELVAERDGEPAVRKG